MRPESYCARIGRLVLGQLESDEPPKRIDQLAQLICGGNDEADALTLNEAARFLGISAPYARALLQRMHERVWGFAIS